MDENFKSDEIKSLTDSHLYEILANNSKTLASLDKTQLEAYRERNSRYELTNGQVYLSYFGSRHIFDAENPQLQEIGKSLKSFITDKDPSKIVVLVEGFIPRTTEDLTYDIHSAGERAFTTHLARNMGLRVECPEPDRKLEVRYLLTHFQPAEIEYYYYLRAVRDFFIKENIHGQKTFEQYSEQIIAGHKHRFGDLQEFAGFDFSFENMKNIHRSITGRDFDEHHMLNVNPRANQSVINRVAQECSSFRDFYHVRNVEKYLREGHSVFIVMGSDHAAIQKPAYEEMFG